ncbi:hypothetical protein QYE76_005385 [Lolium multiflorum]|uniref:Uncharacterized protein n=1 Tax=Lolium multiflorum TaxID=4521 RepID=A0AAD8RSW8_LOLMU|nr:hypothetical protein QYE76_005385 [Lolium multiflorum]
MATAFRTYKKNLAAQYVEKGKTPDFNGHEKLKDDWPEFVRQKKSEEFKAISDKNKANAAKKQDNHIMGPGGYRLSEPKWQKMEDDLRTRGIPLVYQVSSEAPRPTSPPHGGGGGGASPTPPSRQPTPPPFSGGAPPPRPSRRVRTRPQSTSKKRRSWTINPDPYVPKSTKVPEPSMKPLPTRPWERSAEEVDAAAAADYEKWKADCKKKREPEPKPVFSDEQKKWAKSFFSTPSQAAKNLPDDYAHELRRQAKILKEKKDLAEKQQKKALEEAEKEESKKSGKQQVVQLGEQSKQSIPPLIVKAAVRMPRYHNSAQD